MTRPDADQVEVAVPVSAIRVLVVDDDRQIGARLRDLLTDFDHVVVGLASSSLQALVLIKALSPDVVVTDLRMPGMSGLQLAAEARRLPDPPEVIIVSAYDDPSLMTEAGEAGAHAYLVKGTSGERIHDAVVAAAATRAARARP
ncbi:MAG: two-component system, LytTR family, response regulator LytT [Actinomycetota bacterium]|nr:two-component system, LytTR family, response regulator LytT [Actinomycetota bacterium]